MTESKRTFVKKILFVVSDIHGHCDILRDSLEKAGFDPDNENHLLVVMGDLFDRGKQNREVLEYLNAINNKILLKGNHEDILMKSLASGVVGTLQEQNGTVRTIYDFFPEYSGSAYLPVSDPESRSARDMLMRLIDSMGCYFESENYIFTHGWLPVNQDGSIPEGWRYTTAEMWYYARWNRWKNLYGISVIPDGKTLVIGHTPVIYYARGFDPNRDPHSTAPFFGKQMIAIDACTVQSGDLNVLVLEDNIPVCENRTVNIESSIYDALSSEGCRVLVSASCEVAENLIFGDTLTLECEGKEALTRKVTSVHRYNELSEIEDVFTPLELWLSSDGDSLINVYRCAFSLDELVDGGCYAITFA